MQRRKDSQPWYYDLGSEVIGPLIALVCLAGFAYVVLVIRSEYDAAQVARQELHELVRDETDITQQGWVLTTKLGKRYVVRCKIGDYYHVFALRESTDGWFGPDPINEREVLSVVDVTKGE